MSPFLRKVKTASGATAVQIVEKRRGVRTIVEHLGSAHDEAELAALLRIGHDKLHADQPAFDLPTHGGVRPGVAVIEGKRSQLLLDVVRGSWQRLGFDVVADEAFFQLVLARLVEPTSKLDSLRVVADLGVEPVHLSTVKRCLKRCAARDYRDRIAQAWFTHVWSEHGGDVSLLMYDVTTLYFETDTEDELRKVGFSKERRLEPQITVGLLTDASGAPLMVDAFEGNRAETRTMIPIIEQFVRAHGIAGVTVVADAGMMSEANLKDIEDAGWSFVVGGKLPDIPYQVAQWRRTHPAGDPTDGMILTQPTVMGPKADQRRRTTYYQYRADRARRSLHGIDTQVAKAEKAIAGQAAIKRNRFITLTGGTRTVNRDLEAKVRALAGWKPYVTNLEAPAEFVISAYHQLWHVEHSFRMSKHDLKARPVSCRRRHEIGYADPRNMPMCGRDSLSGLFYWRVRSAYS